MGEGQLNNPVVIDLNSDSDSDIEIIHHAFVITDDGTPSKPGPSRRTTQQVCHPHRTDQNVALTTIKRGTSSQRCSSKTNHSKLPGVKVERPADLPELKLLTAQSTTSDDETANDSACEVDGAYSHAEVCDRFGPA